MLRPNNLSCKFFSPVKSRGKIILAGLPAGTSVAAGPGASSASAQTPVIVTRADGSGATAISLTKSAPGLEKILVGPGWEVRAEAEVVAYRLDRREVVREAPPRVNALAPALKVRPA